MCDHQEDRELELDHVETDDGDQGVGFVLPLDTASHHATKLQGWRFCLVKEIVFNHKELVSKAQVNIFGLHFRLGS